MASKTLHKTISKWIWICALLLSVVPVHIAFTKDGDNDSSYVLRRNDKPIDWNKVELLVVQSSHDSLVSILGDREYPYYVLSHTGLKNFLKNGSLKNCKTVNQKGEKVKTTLRLAPEKQIIIFGCSNAVRGLKAADIYRLRLFASNGGYFFTHCWGFTLLGQAFPDYLQVKVNNNFPKTDITGNFPCVLEVDPTEHELFIGKEKAKEEVDFEFSGARPGKILKRNKVEIIYSLQRTGQAAVLRFTFDGDPLDWGQQKKPRGVASGKNEDPQPGQAMNFLFHFAEQRAKDPAIADLRDLIFYNYIILKEKHYDKITAKKK